MTTTISEMAGGAAAGLSTLAAAPGTFTVIYALIALVSFGIIFNETGGGGDFRRKIVQHYLSFVLIWVLFGLPATKTVAVVSTNVESPSNTSVQGVPVGLKYSMVVVDTVIGYLKGALANAVKSKAGIDISNAPAAEEKYRLKMLGATDDIKQMSAQNQLAAQAYVHDCVDWSKVRTTPLKNNTDIYTTTYMAAGVQSQGAETDADSGSSIGTGATSYMPTQTCVSQGQALYQAQSQINIRVAAKQKLSESAVASIDPRTWIAKSAEKAVAGLALHILMFVSHLAAWIYANAIPYFLNIVTALYFAVYPIVLGRALFPGQWTILITYIEGYLWLSFIPLVVLAVDGASFLMTNNYAQALSQSIDLNSALRDLAKIAIVMGVPALSSFLLFGQRPHSFSGLSGVAGAIAGGAALVGAMTARGIGGGGGGGGKKLGAEASGGTDGPKADRTIGGGVPGGGPGGPGGETASAGSGRGPRNPTNHTLDDLYGSADRHGIRHGLGHGNTAASRGTAAEGNTANAGDEALGKMGLSTEKGETDSSGAPGQGTAAGDNAVDTGSGEGTTSADTAVANDIAGEKNTAMGAAGQAPRDGGLKQDTAGNAEKPAAGNGAAGISADGSGTGSRNSVSQGTATGDNATAKTDASPAGKGQNTSGKSRSERKPGWMYAQQTTSESSGPGNNSTNVGNSQQADTSGSGTSRGSGRNSTVGIQQPAGGSGSNSGRAGSATLESSQSRQASIQANVSGNSTTSPGEGPANSTAQQVDSSGISIRSSDPSGDPSKSTSISTASQDAGKQLVKIITQGSAEEAQADNSESADTQPNSSR